MMCMSVDVTLSSVGFEAFAEGCYQHFTIESSAFLNHLYMYFFHKNCFLVCSDVLIKTAGISPYAFLLSVT